MKIKDFMDSLRKNDDKFKSPDGLKLSDMMAMCTSIWSNDACRGYLIEAALRLDMPKEQIAALLRKLSNAFEDISVDEAEKIYIDF